MRQMEFCDLLHFIHQSGSEMIVGKCDRKYFSLHSVCRFILAFSRVLRSVMLHAWRAMKTPGF
jgi:hypothetical protein